METKDDENKRARGLRWISDRGGDHAVRPGVLAATWGVPVKARQWKCPTGAPVVRDAIIIESYRYDLTRTWNPVQNVLIAAGLNPSTAGAEEDDPTVCKVCTLAFNWGYGGIALVNAAAYRATDPDDMFAFGAEVDELGRAGDVRGPLNDAFIRRHVTRRREAIGAAGLVDVLCMWGNRPGRDLVEPLIRALDCEADDVTLMCVGRNLNGSPLHPLYAKNASHALAWDPEPWRAWAARQRPR